MAINRENVAARLMAMSAEDAQIGSDYPDQPVVELWPGQEHRFGPEDDWDLVDDVLRLVEALQPFADAGRLEYRWASTANDERHSTIVFLLTGADVSRGGRFAEVPLWDFTAFAGGTIVDAAIFVIDLAERGFAAGGRV